MQLAASACENRTGTCNNGHRGRNLAVIIFERTQGGDAAQQQYARKSQENNLSAKGFHSLTKIRCVTLILATWVFLRSSCYCTDKNSYAELHGQL